MSEEKEPYPVLQGGEPGPILPGEVLTINGAPWRVAHLEVSTGQATIEPAGEAKLPKPPVRVGQINKDGCWRPCLLNAKGTVLAVLYGPDREQAEAAARVMAAALGPR